MRKWELTPGKQACGIKRLTSTFVAERLFPRDGLSLLPTVSNVSVKVYGRIFAYIMAHISIRVCPKMVSRSTQFEFKSERAG